MSDCESSSSSSSSHRGSGGSGGEAPCIDRDSATDSESRGSELDDSSDGECSDGECSEEGASEGECSESSSQDGDESELGEVAEVTGDQSESAGISAAQEVKELHQETWTEHIRKHGKNHKRPRCRFMRHREEIFKTCTYQCPSGSIGTWVEEVCRPGHPWGGLQAMPMGRHQFNLEPGVCAIRSWHAIDQLDESWESSTRENPERQDQ